MTIRKAASPRQVTTCLAAFLCFATPAVRAQWLNYRIPGIPLSEIDIKIDDPKAYVKPWTSKCPPICCPTAI
jgi:hypothetical protein